MMLHNVVIPFVLSAALLTYDIYLIRKGKFIRLPFAHIPIFIGFIIYILIFLFNDFTLKEAFVHSSRSLNLALKLSASWSGSGGYIVWWLFVFSLIAFIFRLRMKECSGNLCVYHNLMIIALFIIALLNDAFSTVDFYPKDGLGLNPLLKSVWMYFHPPATFIGYALGLFIAINVFFNRHNSLLTSLAWIFITIANILGAVWSYFTLGWGGYWAWDPVETSLLLPWLSITAYFHSRKLRNFFLALTGFSVAYAAFVTRGGVSFLHGFALSYVGTVIILLGIPFLVKAFREFKFGLEDLKDTMNIASISLLGIYIVCLSGLIYQSVYMVFRQGVVIDVDYYNFSSLPFVATFLLTLPICRFSIKRYPLLLALVLITSVYLSILTVLGLIRWCGDSPIATNAAISFMIPVSAFSLAGVLYGFTKTDMRSLGLKIIHMSIPLLIIGVLISGPYAYHQASFKPIMIKSGEEMTMDGLSLKYVDMKYVEPREKVSLDGFIVIPEESEAILRFKVNGEYLDMKIRFNLALYLRERGYTISEPAVVNRGLDEYYLVIPSIYVFDLFIFHSKFMYQNGGNEFILRSLARSVNLSYEEFVYRLNSWSQETSHMKRVALIMYKYIPCVNLIWIASALMIGGEILNLVVRRR